ncbi:MAG: flippase-like domain-containing protein [Planctomycetota bacterium]
MTYPRAAAPKRKWIKFTLSIAAAAILLYLLLRGVDWEDAWAVLRKLSPEAWICAFGVHASIYALRTLRFASLIPDRRVPFTNLWSIQSANQMAAQLLPLRTGEITYPIYLRNAGVPLEVGVAGLIVSRALDLLAVLTIAVFSAILVETPLQQLPKGTAVPLIFILALTAAALIAVATGGAPFIRSLTAIAARMGAGIRIVGRVEQVARGFETVGRYRAVAEAFALTLLIWIGVDMFYYILMRDLGFHNLGPGDVAFGASAAILTNLLPINSFAGLGTQEWGWSWGFEQLGLTRTEAAASALAVHAVQLVNVGLLGLIAQFRLNPKPRGEQARAFVLLQKNRAKLLHTIQKITDEEAQIRPGPGRWSVIETIEHLAKVEESVFVKLEEILKQPGDVAAGRRVRIPIRAVVFRPPMLRFPAPAFVLPVSDSKITIKDALASLTAAREKLILTIQAHEDVVLRGKRFRHQIFGALDGLEWAKLMAYHEERHRKQILETLRAVRSHGVESAPAVR